MLRVAGPLPCGALRAPALLAPLWLLLGASAQPLEGTFLRAARQPAERPPAPPEPPPPPGADRLAATPAPAPAPAPTPSPPAKSGAPECPAGYYQASGILWGCSGTMGRQVLHLEPNSAVDVAELPAGMRNFSVKVSSFRGVAMRVEDPARGGGPAVLEAGELAAGFAAPQGPFHYRRGDEDTEALLISGSLSSRLLLGLAVGPGAEGGTAELEYRYDGLGVCPLVPAGCRADDDPAAEGEVRAWGAWAREKFGDAEAAWEALSAIGQRGAATTRRLGDGAGISERGWQAIWKYSHAGSGGSGWKGSFHFLDKDHDGTIAKSEFERGYALGPVATTPDPASDRALSHDSDKGAASSFPIWPFLVILPLALAACYVWKNRWILEATVNKAKPYLPTRCVSILEKVMGSKPSEPETTKLMTGSEDVTKVHEAEVPGQVSTLVPTEERRWNTRGGFCSLMSCAWSRDESRKPDLPGPPQPFQASRQMGSVDEVEAILEQMRMAKSDLSVQEAGCKRLEELALDAELKQRVADCGGPDTIISAMYAHPSSPTLQEHACAALGNQACEADDQRVALVDQGAMRAVIKAMIEHASSFRVQETACWALRECSLIGEGRREIADCGGLERILRAMQNHPAAVAVLEHGLMAMAYLAYDTELRRWIAYDGGVNVILKSMAAQPDDSVIQEAACLTLRNMACTPETRQAVLDLQGDEAILEAMAAHGPCATLQETACDALQILGPGPGRLAELRAHEAVVAAMLRNPSEEGLQAKACGVLAHMASDEGARALVRRSRALDMVLAAREHFCMSEEVLEAADRAAQAIRQE